jgi:hypothetical protein
MDYLNVIEVSSLLHKLWAASGEFQAKIACFKTECAIAKINAQRSLQTLHVHVLLYFKYLM